MARRKENVEGAPLEAPKTPTDALASGRGGTPPSGRRSRVKGRVTRAGSSRAMGRTAPRATKRVSGRKQAERRTAAKRSVAKAGKLRTGVATRAKQTTQRRSNKGGRASGP